MKFRLSDLEEKLFFKNSKQIVNRENNTSKNSVNKL